MRVNHSVNGRGLLLTLMTRFLHILLALCLLLPLGASAHAQSKKVNKYASIIIDADSLEILHARNIDGARFPASLTKMMTLYLVFDALERGELRLDEKLTISARASRTPPVRLGLRAGQTITVEQAIMALTVRSANDAATVLAERLGGSEDEFAALMSAKAKSLGMQSSIFQNPHGLPNPGQTTTARDMAKLAESLLRNHKKYYGYFSRASFTYKGRTYNNHNTLLGRVEGVDGFKTGFTNASGYNLVISAKRGDHRIIAVVLGGASGTSRDKHMADLIERGFDVIGQQGRAPSQMVSADEVQRSVRIVQPVPSDKIQSYTLRAAHNAPQSTVHVVQGAGTRAVAQYAPRSWAVQIGAYHTALQAEAANHLVQTDTDLPLSDAAPHIIPVARQNGFIYRARLGGLSHEAAQKVCESLAQRRQSCLVISPN